MKHVKERKRKGMLKLPLMCPTSNLRFSYFNRPQSNHLFGLCVPQILLFQVSEYWLQGAPLSWHHFEKQGAGNGCSFIYKGYKCLQSKTLS